MQLPADGVGEPVGLPADHERHPLGERRVEQRGRHGRRGRSVQPEQDEAGVGEGGEPGRRGPGAQHRGVEGDPGRRLDHQRVDRGHSASRQEHPVEPGRGGRPQDHPDVGRVGQPVEDEDLRARGVFQRGEEPLDGAHARRHHVGDDALVLAPVPGEHLHPLRGRPTDTDAARGRGVGERLRRAGVHALGENDLVHRERGVAERLEHGLASVDGDEAVLGGGDRLVVGGE